MNESVWGAGLLAGVLTTVFGVAVVFWPGLTFLTLLYLFAAYVLVDGIVNFFNGINGVASKSSTWFLGTILGMLEVGVGVYFVQHTALAFKTFILLMGFTLVFRGVFTLVSAYAEKVSEDDRMLLVVGSFLSLIVGIVVLFQPVAKGISFVWLLGLYALITGPLSLAVLLKSSKR